MQNENNKTGQGLYGKWKNALDLALSGKSKRQRLLYPVLSAFFAAIAFLLTNFPFKISVPIIGSPLSDALLCSAGAYTPFVYAGCVLGSIYFGKMSIQRILALSFIFVLRIITSSKSISAGVSDEIFKEKVITKLAVSAVMCFIQCATFLATNGINANTTRGVLLTLIVTPITTFVFSIYYAKKGETVAQRFMYELAMLFIFACSVYCAKDISFAFFKIDTVLAIFFILCISKHGGLARGAIYGTALGYIASATYFASFSLLGAVCALIFSFGAYSACGIACATACICSIMIGGANALVSIVPETIMACAVTSPILRYSFLPSGFPFPLTDAGYAESFSENARRVLQEISLVNSLKNATANLRGISEGVNDACAPFDRSGPNASEIAERICNELCDSCPLSPICHETNVIITKEALTELAQRQIDGHEKHSVPIQLSSHCIRLRELTEYTARIVSEQSEEHRHPTLSPTLTYPAVADIISDVGTKAENELVFDGAAEKAVSRLLYTSGIAFGGVSVIGSIRKKVCIYGANIGKMKKSLPQIQIGLKEIFGFPFGEPSFSNNVSQPVVFSPARSLKTEIAVAAHTKLGESFSGDTVLTFDDEQDNFYALISDGMGSGESAGRSSAITAELIRRLMLSGIDTSLAVRLAGEALPSLCDECFSTVDLMKLDLVSGQASVIKNHAAASYVLRNGSAYCLRCSSMPIGINSEATSEKVTFNLEHGDTVVMVSDGVADGPTDKVKIQDIIGIEGSLNAETLANRILSKASEIKGQSDDMTALVIKIKSA